MGARDAGLGAVMTQRTVLFIGSPDAGKSNYLFRLWLALRDGKHRRLQPQQAPPDDVAYLNAGANDQLRGEYAQRTLGEVNERPILPLMVDSEPVTLMAPDRPGEDWDKLYAERRWPGGWIDLLTPSTSYLLFVPTRGTVPLSSWFQVQAMRGPEANFTRAADGSSAAPPMQVVASDWIQMIVKAHQRATQWSTTSPPPRIGIILTGWDNVIRDGDTSTPAQFLKREHRLLYELASNIAPAAVCEVFGTSIYGDDLNDVAFKGELRDGEVRPQDRGYVVRGDSTEPVTDLALPVAWALGVEETSG